MRRHVPGICTTVVLTAFLLGGVLAEPPCQIDEPGWITAGAITVRLITHLEPPSRWAVAYDEAHLGDWGNLNPPLGKLYLGLFVPFAGEYHWPAALPPMPLLTAARIGIVLSAGVLLWLVYLVAVELGSGSWAIVAPIGLFLLPVFQFHATHVYTDMPQLSLMMWSAWLLFRRRWIWAAVIAGLACAVKFNSAPIVVAGIAIVALRAKSWRQMVLAAVVPVFVFVAVNPYLWPAPISRTAGIMRAWDTRKIEQQAERPYQAVTSPLEAAQYVVQRAIMSPDQTPPFAPIWPAWISLGISVLCVGAVGVTMLRPPTDALIILSAQIVFTIIWLPLEWARYYLPISIWMPILIARALPMMRLAPLLDRSSMTAETADR